MASEKNAPDTSVNCVVMPSPADVRAHARELFETANEVDLAKSIIDGDRVGSYEPYMEWLKAGRHPDLYKLQLAEWLISDAAINKDKEFIVRLIAKASGYLVKT